MKPNNQLFLPCECQHEILAIEKDEETKEVYISFYGYGHKRAKYGLKDKLHLIWRIIKDGTPYLDNVILGEESKNKLIEFLKEDK